MMVRAHARLIPKEYQRLIFAGQTLNPGIVFSQPSFDILRLLLVRAPDGTLGSQSQLIQQAANRGLTQLDIKPLTNDLPNHLCGPERKRKSQLQRILGGYGVIDPFERLAIQFWGSPSPLLSIKGPPATMAIPRQPTINRYPVNSKGLSDNFWALSLLNTGYASLSQFSQRLMAKPSSIHLFHGYYYIMAQVPTEWVKLSYETY